MNRISRALCLAAVPALALTFGAGPAQAEGVSADRLQVDTNTNLTDGDEFLVDVQVSSVDDSGDANGVRSRTTSSDIMDLEGVQSDNRTASNDEGHESSSGRVILGLDSLRGQDGIESDVDLVMIDRDNETDDSMSADDITGPSDDTTADDQQYGEDSEFVFGG